MTITRRDWWAWAERSHVPNVLTGITALIAIGWAIALLLDTEAMRLIGALSKTFTWAHPYVWAAALAAGGAGTLVALLLGRRGAPFLPMAALMLTFAGWCVSVAAGSPTSVPLSLILAFFPFIVVAALTAMHGREARHHDHD